MALSREGLTIDLVARFSRKTVLSPVVPFIISLAWIGVLATPYSTNDIALSRITQLTCPWIIVVSLWGLLNISLWVNDYLNDGYANNWTTDPTWDWDKEIVLVTGGSSGIGASIIQHLLKRNLKTTIIILDYASLSWTPPPRSNVHYYQCDLSSSATVKTISAKVRKEVGNPTVLINNAGLARGSTVMEGSYTDVEITVRTNLIAPFLLTKEFLPHMVRNNHGHILNTSSMSSIMPPARIADYSATKAGLNALHEALQLELKNIHNAPNVRLTLGIFSFIRTPLLNGDAGMSNFFAPILHVDTVGETLANIIHSGRGRRLYMPGLMRYVHTMQALPEWMVRIMKESQKMGIDFRGRQKVDEKTGGLAQE